MQVGVFEAKTDFSRLIRLVESRREESITVARNGRPVAKIVPYDNAPVSKRIGVAKGKFEVPDDFDAGNEEIAAMLMGGEL
jgi:prevent-host-death family protein